MNADEITGGLVHQIMWLRRIPQRELATVLKLDQASLSRKLRGARSWSLDELLATARYFDVPITELLPGEDYDPSPEGRGRGAVRHQGLEPRTRWFRGSVDILGSIPLIAA